MSKIIETSQHADKLPVGKKVMRRGRWYIVIKQVKKIEDGMVVYKSEMEPA